MSKMRYYRNMQFLQVITATANLAVVAWFAPKGYYLLASINLACATSQICSFLHARYRAKAIRRMAAAHGMTWQEFEKTQAQGVPSYSHYG